ncbi:hypothetical protein HYALB_00000563 [Hymenoscyphus albidus]|uniref:Amino acid permease/ SLC12A domain-containing protein n=1 Tax=Hymenoscyphus albidus TaxID=595503 RepID=A0A9N9M2B4_9HELO|nr:hypothetical protein HYALB_00000563 [Hymenoscyphus albidus]
MAVTFPVSGSFCAFTTRFVDPAWGFAQGWNYAMNWLFVMPLEIMAAAITLEFWDSGIPPFASVTIFLSFIIAINLSSIKGFGEAEYIFSIIKVTAIIGFIILGVVLNCGGGQDEGYIGGKYWVAPGAFNDGFKGFCAILTTAAFSFSGTEMVGLAAAETYNPSKSVPGAIKQTFWRITLFYIVSIVVIGLLVPSTSPQLVGRNDVDAKASPFIIAITGAGIQGLDSVMNVIVLISVLSVANSSMFASSRTLVALAEQGQAPQFLAKTDRKGRPLYAIALASAVGLLAYLYATPIQGPDFTWLLALAGLSAIFNWLSIAAAHIKFRKAWADQGYTASDLIYTPPVGAYGSWGSFIALVFVLAAEFWTAIAPRGYQDFSAVERLSYFFETFLALPVVLLCYIGYKLTYRTSWVRIQDIDLQTGRNAHEIDVVRQRWKDERSEWPRWKKIYHTLC